MSYDQLQKENIILYKVLAKEQAKLEKIKGELEKLDVNEVTFKEIYYLKKYLLDIISGIERKE